MSILKVIGGIVVAFFALIVLAACLAVVGSDSGSDSASAPPASTAPGEPGPAPAQEVDDAAADITIDTCEVTDLAGTKFAEPAYTITNSQDDSQDYLFTIAVIDSTGATVSQANGIEPNVLPGRPSKGKAMGNVSDSAVAPFTCEVSDVTRYGS